MSVKTVSPLEALEEIKSHYNDRVCIDILEDFDIIKKGLKALEIIKEKKVDADGFIYNHYKDCDDYNKHSNRHDLTKEEFNLLKEVLK